MSVRTKLWTREEYDRLIAAGGFEPESRVQLIRGEIVEMAPQNARHATGILRAEQALRRIFAGGFVVRTQLPLALGSWSEPEPDVAVVRGTIDDYRDAHPESAALVVEVADSTLDFDRTRKREMYAEAGIPEYWIVNLIDGVLEVSRTPAGMTYQDVQHLSPGEVIAPAAATSGTIPVSELLPL